MNTDRVTGVGVARTYYLWEIGHHQDLTWYGYDLFNASVAEIQLAIICICLPFVRSFFRAYYPHLFATTGMRTTSSPGHRPSTDWTVIGEEGEVDAKLVYELDEKGMVVAANKRPSNPPPGELALTQEEEDEIEWARQQVQRSDYIPQQPQSPSSRKTLSTIGSLDEIDDEARILGMQQRLQKSEEERRKVSFDDAEQDEEWKRSKVREWVTKRPVKRVSVTE